MNPLVVDAWGVIAWLKGEAPGAGHMDRLFVAAESGECLLTICVINLGEVYYSAARHRGAAQATLDVALLRTRLSVVPAPEELVMRAARLKANHRISYADAFAAATAVALGTRLVTGDPELRVLAGTVPTLQLQWIGR